MIWGSDCSFTSNNSLSLSVIVIYCLKTIDLYHLNIYLFQTFFQTELGLAEHFNFVMTSEESKAEKPNREIFDMAMEKIQCSDPATAYHVGTSIDYDVSNFTTNLHQFIIFCILLIFHHYRPVTLTSFYLLQHWLRFFTLFLTVSFHYLSCTTLSLSN